MMIRKWTVGVAGTALMLALTACQEAARVVAPIESGEELALEATAPPEGIHPAEAPTWDLGVSQAPVPCRPFGAPDGSEDRALAASARGAPDSDVCAVPEAPMSFAPVGAEGRGPKGEALSASALTPRATDKGGIPTMLSAATLLAPTGHAPSGQVGTVRPTFQWDAVSGATSYLVFIRDSGTLGSGPPRVERWVTAETAGCPNSTDSCAWVVDTDLMEGDGRWWVRGWNSTDDGAWSPTVNFEISATGPLPGPVLTGPTGTADSRRPTLQWQALQGSTWYQLFVRDSETVDGAAKVQQWVTADQASCGSGLGSCNWALDRDLASGEVRWWVRGWQASSGNGAWSALGVFQVDEPTALAAPNAQSPSGVITATQPEFGWDAVAGANWYRVFIRDGATMTGAPRVDRWVRATDAGCGSETGMCSWTSDTELSTGEGIWWVLAWSDAALSGPWSAGLNFTVSLTPALQAPVPVGPTGATIYLRPTLEWQRVPGASHYLVFLRDSDTETGSPKVEEWVTSTEAGCGAGGSCRWTVDTDLAGGAVQWWTRAWNEVEGSGPWSGAAGFEVTMLPAPQLLEPDNLITEAQPQFSWEAVTGATWYRVSIRDGTTATGAPKVDRWVRATDVGCADGSGVCAWTSDTALSNGDGGWRVHGWNETPQGGEWSLTRSFTADVPGPPGAATLVGPSGDIEDIRPEFRWNAAPTSTWYRVQVRESASEIVTVDEWITAETAQCSSGTDTCRWTATKDLAPGLNSWWIQTWSEDGLGPWSAEMQFELPPREIETVGEVPPPPGPNDPSDGWTGNTIPVRIIEGGSMTGIPVPVTITANGVSKTFHRSWVGQGRTVNVPRGVPLTVTAHFTPNPAAGLQHFGFSALKMKEMNADWGFQPHQISHENNTVWEPYTNGAAHDQPPKASWVWGGSLSGVCGHLGTGVADPFWRYSPPTWITSDSRIDFLVVWLLDHQYPRHSC